MNSQVAMGGNDQHRYDRKGSDSSSFTIWTRRLEASPQPLLFSGRFSGKSCRFIAEDAAEPSYETQSGRARHSLRHYTWRLRLTKFSVKFPIVPRYVAVADQGTLSSFLLCRNQNKWKELLIRSTSRTGQKLSSAKTDDTIQVRT